MKIRTLYNLLLVTLLLLFTAGCKKDHEIDTSTGPSAQEVKEMVDYLAKNMKPITTDSLTRKMVGKDCVVAAVTDQDRGSSSPPPPGMMQILGATTIYTATLADFNSESLTVKADYPSGKTKQVEIPLEHVQELAIKN